MFFTVTSFLTQNIADLERKKALPWEYLDFVVRKIKFLLGYVKFSLMKWWQCSGTYL